MYCQYCGKQVDDDAVFCKFCGKKISSQSIKEAEGFDGKECDNLNVVSNQDSLASEKVHSKDKEPVIQSLTNKQTELSIMYGPYYVEQFRAKCGLRCEHRLLRFSKYVTTEMADQFGWALILCIVPWIVTCITTIPTYLLGTLISKILVSKENAYYLRKKAYMANRWEAKYSDYVEYDEKEGYVYKGPMITDAIIEKPNVFVRFYKKTMLSYIVGFLFYMISLYIVAGIIALIAYPFS